MRVVYYADDGREFETEAGCRQYEKKLDDLLCELKNGIHAYDEDGNVIDFLDVDPEELYDIFEQITYLQFDTQKAIDVFTEKANDFGIPCLRHNIYKPLVVGERYYYDYDFGNWYCLEDRQKELDKIANVFK